MSLVRPWKEDDPWTREENQLHNFECQIIRYGVPEQVCLDLLDLVADLNDDLKNMRSNAVGRFARGMADRIARFRSEEEGQ